MVVIHRAIRQDLRRIAACLAEIAGRGAPPMAVVGWAFGVLLGWLIYQVLLALLIHDAALSLPQEFPSFIPLIALAGVLALTLIVIRGPLRRATRIHPGTALRYQ